MRNRRLEELAERVAALENAVAGGRPSDLDERLLAIETALRRLSHGDGELDQLADVLRRCTDLIAERVPDGERVLVAWQGDPAMLALRSRPVVPFPRPTGALAEGDFEHGASAIAQLEAQRQRGIRFLLVPEQGRPWLEELNSFRQHLLAHYELIADEEGAGLLIDVGSRREATDSNETLIDALERILDGERYAPVLDWTGFGLGAMIKDRGIFPAPPEADGELPYLDRSIDVVVVDDPDHLDEGRRVATSAVLLVEPAGDEAGGLRVAQVEEASRDQQIAEEVPVVTGASSWGAAGESGSDVVALAEDGVQPLPGCIEVAAATLQHREDAGAVAVKLLDADGLLEGAGTMVFADGSAEGIGAGSAEVCAPWHEYVRPVCAGSGLLVTRASALREIPTPTTSLVELCGRLRAAGHGLVYQPEAWAVRVLPGERPDDADSPGDAWSAVLPTRPKRPETLNRSAWRWLLTHVDVEEGWR